MDLLLWRHADAAYGSPDDARPLTAEGEKQAHRMAQWLSQNAPKNLRILVSPATRTQQTVRAWTSHYETTPLVGTSAHAQDIITACGWPAASGAVLVVGHQPTLGHVASLLLHGREEELSFHKGAIWWFRYRIRDGLEQTVLRAVVNAEHLF